MQSRKHFSCCKPEDEKKLMKMVDDLTADPVIAPVTINIPAASAQNKEIQADEDARLAKKNKKKKMRSSWL